MIDDILSEWKSRMLRSSQGLVSRELDLSPALRPELATIVLGPRRAGKSTLLGQLPALLKLPKKHCWYCNFEDPKLLPFLDTSLLDAIADRALKNLRAQERAYLFLDEIQNVLGWEKWVHKTLTGNHQLILVLTGSNSSMLSGELATAMTGRYRAFELFPFSLQEYGQNKKDKSWTDYLRDGGFPDALTDAEPTVYLKELFRNVVLRDIAPSVGVRSPTALLQCIAMVMQSIGSELSLRRLAGALSIAPDTVHQYIEASESAYLIFGCRYFSHSIRQQVRRQKKYYAIDTALRAAVSQTSDRDHGKALENAVYLSLRRRGIECYYWRGKREVDFVAVHNSKIIPIQVSWGAPQERHELALQEFFEQHPGSEEPIFVGPGNAAEFLNDAGAVLF